MHDRTSTHRGPGACGNPSATKAKQAKTGKAYTPPKTPWGDPDLEGVWPGNMGVPMQRNAKLGERATLTDEEFAAKEVAAKKQAQADSESVVDQRFQGRNRPAVVLDRAREADPPDFADRRSSGRADCRT